MTVELHPHPLPSATMRIKVFGYLAGQQPDGPPTRRQAGRFRVTINDTLGQVSVDVFGNPLCTTTTPTSFRPARPTVCYTATQRRRVVPTWGRCAMTCWSRRPTAPTGSETTTLEGSPSWDTWLQEGGTGLDNSLSSPATFP